jgi:exodeoxyribonuclease-3
MKFATWNINSLTVRLGHVLDWLTANPVDVLALQEIKLIDDKFPHQMLRTAGYVAQVFGQKTYNGVALLIRLPLAVTELTRGIPGYADDAARVIAGTVQSASGPVRVVNGYFVNGQTPGSEKFEYKLTWLRALREALRAELAVHPRLIVLGDFNIVPEDRDSFDPVGLAATILHTDEEREHFRQLLKLGLVDAFRLFEQPEKSFSWWDYRLLSFQKNWGLRIDHILVSQPLVAEVAACAIDRTPRKWIKPSDHAPVVVTLGHPEEP